MLAFPLHMGIMTDGSFPFPAIGTVHVGNSITRHRPISPSEKLDVSATAVNLRPHPKGRVFDLVTTVTVAGSEETVWESTSKYLRTGKGDKDAKAEGDPFDLIPGTGIVWRLPGDLGRDYASVSGDHNPIHLYPFTAKAFGFPRQIAHGMWTKARCVAAMANRLPDSARVEVEFKKPVFLPGKVAFGSAPARRRPGLLADQPGQRRPAPAGQGPLPSEPSAQRLSPNGTQPAGDPTAGLRQPLVERAVGGSPDRDVVHLVAVEVPGRPAGRPALP